MGNQTRRTGQMVRSMTDAFPYETIIGSSPNRVEFSSINQCTIQINVFYVITLDHDVDIMAIDGSKLILTVEGAKGDFVNPLLNRRNPGHGWVTIVRAILFHRLLPCRVVKIHHTRHRSLNETRAFRSLDVECERLAKLKSR